MTDMLSFLLEILKYSVTGLIIFFVAWYYIRLQLDKPKSVKTEAIKKPDPGLLTLKLQAYERLVLFIERINPQNMLLRIQIPGGSVIQLQQQVLTEIRAEYQHNITQQIYVSSEFWHLLKKLKEDTMYMFNNASRNFRPEDSSIELSKAILAHLASLEPNPYDVALEFLKREVKLNVNLN